jgi:hypothetical protein
MTKENKVIMIAGLATLGHAAGIILAVHRKSGFWGGVGWFIVGGMVGGGLGYAITAMVNSDTQVTPASSVTNDQVNRLMNAAASSGSDTFEGMTIADIKTKWLKNSSEADVNRMITLFEKSEAQSTPNEILELNTLLAKGAGVSVEQLQS